MKINTHILITLIITLTSCISEVQGVGFSTEQDIKVERGYKNLYIEDGINVTMGNFVTSSICGDAAVIPYIETIQSDEDLTIKLKDKIRLDEDCGFSVNLPDNYWLESIHLSGSGTFSTDNNYSLGKSLTLTASGTSEMNASVKSGEIHISANGSTQIKLEGEINLVYLTLKGNSSVSGTDKFPYSFVTQAVYADMSGDSSFKARCEGTVWGSLCGNASFSYSGSAKIRATTEDNAEISKHEE